MTVPPAGTLKPAVGDADHALGPADAPITLVEYGDYQCPHCARAHVVVSKVRRRLGDRVRFVFRDFPLSELHPNALHAAEAAQSVGASLGEAGFWKIHDAMFQHQRDSDDSLDDAHLLQYAADIGADPEVVRADLENATHEQKVKAEFMSGVRSGVNGTPTFFVNGHRFEGDWSSAESFVEAIEADAQ